MMNRMLILITVPLFSSLLSQGVSAQNGVRLFLSPAERLELERRRLGIAEPEPVITSTIQRVVDLIDQEPVEDVIYELGGSMVKNDGTATVWLNGESIDQADLPGNIQIQQPPSMGLLSIMSNGQRYTIKPGQVLNATTGVIYEAYQWQEQLEIQRLAELAREGSEIAEEVKIGRAHV